MQARGQAFFISISYGLGGTLGGLILSVGWERLSPQSVYWMAMVMVLLALAAALVSYRWQKQAGMEKIME
jgi:MFS transporter, PPP family, 3-phenylpropionic acid transporter